LIKKLAKDEYYGNW
jgi:hypothetical protein